MDTKYNVHKLNQDFDKKLTESLIKNSSILIKKINCEERKKKLFMFKWVIVLCGVRDFRSAIIRSVY